MSRGIAGLTLAGLLFGRLTFSLLLPTISYFYHWDIWDSVALILDVALLAVLLVLGSTLPRLLRGKTVGLVFESAFLLVLAEGVLACLRPLNSNPTPFRYFTGGVLIGLVVLMAVLRPGPRARLVRFARMMTLILFPLPIAVIAVAMAVPKWGPSRQPRPAPASVSRPGPPVFLFIFDMWSYDRSTRDETLLPSLKNLRALSEESLWFTRAYSRSFRTKQSLPAILFQTNQEFLIENQGTFWRSGSTLIPTPRVPSLFQRARDRGYRTDLLGFYHPYHKLVEGQLDDCDALCESPKGTGLLGRMAALAFKNSRSLADPVLPFVGSLIEWPLFRKHWYKLNVRTLAATERLIGRSPSNTFAVIHWPYPHAPYVFDADGNFRSIGLTDQLHALRAEARGEAEGDGTPEEYDQAIRQTDRFVGRAMAALKASGKYDEAMIILTSDHSWRTDPLPRTDRAKSPHVPLLIKMPHQAAMHVIDRPVINYDIKALIEGVLENRLDDQGAMDLINAGRLPGPPE